MDIFTAVADPTRRRIVELLAAEGRLPATHICHQFPVSGPAISQHLKVLREAKLVIVERQAQQRLYRLNPLTMHELEFWARRLASQWEERFSRLDELLEREKIKSINQTKKG